MSRYIIIDGGTTNTRIYLVNNKRVVDSLKLSTVAYDNINSSGLLKSDITASIKLKNEIKLSIKKILKNNFISEKDVAKILASGMITSEFGICKIDHILLPAGIEELHASSRELQIKEISSIPFIFICGVKASGSGYENCDVMQGEETELMGIINKSYGNCLYVLPGSHSKLINTDSQGKITDFQTMLTGEMIKSLSQNTILKDAVDLLTSNTDASYLLEGYDYCVCEGINKALFKVRILKNIFNRSKNEIYSFFLGIVLSAEIEQIKKSDAQTIVIGGRSQIKNALSFILNKRCDKKIITLDEETVNNSTVLGAIKIYEKDFS